MLTMVGPKSPGTSSSLRKTCKQLCVVSRSSVTLDFEIEFHPVIRQAHVVRQHGVGRGMRQVVANMREERALRLEFFHDAQRVCHCRVRRMRLVSQRIQKENVEISQLLERLLRHFAEVGQIGRRSDAVAVDLGLTVNYRDRVDARTEKFKRAVNIDQFQLRYSAKLIVSLKDVTKHASQKVGRFRPGVEWNLPRAMKTQRA